MLRYSRKILFIIMLVAALIGCREEKGSDTQVLLSDKQSQQETMTKSDAVKSTTTDLEEDGSAGQVSQKPTSQQRVVYTKLESWSNRADYYEIAFNTAFAGEVTNVNLDQFMTFSPRLSGKFLIQDDKIVRFYPAKRFEADKTYKVTINQAKLLAGDYPTVELQFYNSSPVLKLGQVSLQPTEKDEEYTLEVNINHYRGRYLDEDYRNGIEIKVDKERLEIAKLDFTNNELVLTTAPFTSNAKSVILVSSKKDLFSDKNSNQLYFSNSIAEMRKLTFHRAETETNKQGEANFEISFSKNLDAEQSLSGLIAVHQGREEIEVNLSKYRNKVIISGNLRLNAQYRISLRKGLKGADGSVLTKTITAVATTQNRDRELDFVDKGIFLSSHNKNAINIKAVNYPKFTYYLWSIQVENIAEMLHNLNLGNYAFNQQGNYYRDENLNWYGELVKQETIVTNVEDDKDSIIELNLGEVVKSDPSKIYILNLQGEFEQNDKLSIKSRYSRYGGGNQVGKMIIFTDLAVSAKAFNDKVMINVTNITDASPVKRANVELRMFNNTLLQADKTDRNGELLLDKLAQPLDRSAFFIVAEKSGAIGFLASSEMSIDDTKFRIERDYSQDEVKLEAFTERSEYRPGETVNLMVMLRDRDNQVINNDLPVVITIYDARNAKVISEKLTDFSEGFATYQYPTTSDTATGAWRMEVEYGTVSKYVFFKIETFVPERINVKLKPDKESYDHNDEYLNLTISSNYLFGEPLANAKCKIDFYCWYNDNLGKEMFPDYSFDIPKIDPTTFNQTQQLVNDENGEITTSFKLLTSKESPTPYDINITATVQEEGGRPIARVVRPTVSPQSKYIGLIGNQYLKGNEGEFKVPVVVVDESGTKLAEGTEVEYAIYGKRGYWWWDYDYRYSASFKNAESTQVIKSGKLTIGKDKAISFTAQTTDYNRFLVEVKLVGNEDYVVNREYYNSYWGDNPELTEDSSIELKSDKESYQIGDEVSVSIPASKGNKVQISLVKQNRLISHEVINITKNGDYIYKFKTDKSMVPNIFISARVIQGQRDKQNDMPLRLFGIIPIQIHNAETKLDITIDSPTRMNSNSTLKGTIDVGVKTKTKYIVSIVDEGLTNKSNYVIPNPWELFYKSEGYYANDFDNFSYFINAKNLEIFRTIMIGGDAMYNDEMSLSGSGKRKEVMDALNRLQETGVTRFKPVSYFLGILETDGKGKGEFEVEVGDYVGALKITVIAANETAFGKAVEHVIVKDDIIAMPTLPRVLTPLDEFEIPISIVKEANITSPIELTLLTNEMCEIVAESTKTLTSNQANQLVIFKVRVKDNIGKAVFTFKVKSKEFQSSKTIEVGVRLPSAYQSQSEVLTLTNNEVKYTIPELGYANSNQTYLSFNQGFEFDAEQHLKHSVTYPYGGASHITATTFVQLLLADFIDDDNLRNDLDYHINSYFKKIVSFNRQGLWHWAGNWKNETDRKLLNAYALHTFIIAREKGYNINEFVYGEIENYLRNNKEIAGTIDFAEAYRLYVLALANKADISTLNYYNEQAKLKVDSRAKIMLEMAYQESHFNVQDITKDLKPAVELVIKAQQDYKAMEPTESVVNALDLYFNSLYNRDRNPASLRATALSIAKGMQDPYFWNIYDKGWQLFAINGFVKTFPKNPKMFTEASLEVKIGDKTEVIKVKDAYLMDLTQDKGKTLTIRGLSGNASDLFITINQVFVPKMNAVKSSSNNLELVITYTDLNGEKLDVTSLEQSTNFYAEVKTFCQLRNMDVATTFILPSGWEFVDDENHAELIGYQRYDTQPDFVDVRDDRAVIYLKNRSEKEVNYKFKIVAITKGKFMMPATVSEDTYQAENSAVIKGKQIIINNE